MPQFPIIPTLLFSPAKSPKASDPLNVGKAVIGLIDAYSDSYIPVSTHRTPRLGGWPSPGA